MSTQRFERLLVRAANNYGELSGADMADALLLRDAELVKEVVPGRVPPRYKLTVLGWRMARKLNEADGRLAARDECLLREVAEGQGNGQRDDGQREQENVG